MGSDTVARRPEFVRQRLHVISKGGRGGSNRRLADLEQLRFGHIRQLAQKSIARSQFAVISDEVLHLRNSMAERTGEKAGECRQAYALARIVAHVLSNIDHVLYSLDGLLIELTDIVGDARDRLAHRLRRLAHRSGHAVDRSRDPAFERF